MKLKYNLDEKVFRNKEAYNKSLEMVENGELEVEDIKFLIDSRIRGLYAELSSLFFYDKNDFNSIYERKEVIEYIERWYGSRIDVTLYYFHILLDNEIISNCGSGYMFDYKSKEIKSAEERKEDKKRLGELLFKRRIVI